MFDKFVAIILLLLAAFVDVKYVQFIIHPDVQLIIGTMIVAIIIFYDALSGFILGITMLVLYLRVFSNKYNIDIKEFITGKKTPEYQYPMDSLVTDGYITPKNLEDAQNNIIDMNSYNKEIKGFKGAYNEPVYGAQGIDSMMPGYGEIEAGESLSKRR
jgi:hypothetical protein